MKRNGGKRKMRKKPLYKVSVLLFSLILLISFPVNAEPVSGDMTESENAADLPVQADTPDEQSAQEAGQPLNTDNVEPAVPETATLQSAPVSRPDALSTDIPEPPKLPYTAAAASAPATQCTIHWGLTLIEA